ncbi:MAG: hypothetical protein GF329_22330 [Candidatus Lokiarchaeota archaeon]|nr:hypothetical protein [Candidatus Lokiarchaeota archaeon]
MNEKLLDVDNYRRCREKCNGRDRSVCLLKKHFKALKSKEIIEKTLGYASEEIYQLALENSSSKKRKKSIHKVKKMLKKVNRSQYLYLKEKGNILLTAPHAAWAYRYAWGKNRRKLGDWIKSSDINTGILACCLGNVLKVPVLIQIYTAFLDPNFYLEALFREGLREILRNGRIKFVLDIHGLSDDRNADFDIIDMFGLSLLPFNALKLRETLKDRLEKLGLDIGVNRFFNGGLNLPFQHTIIKEVTQEFQIPCIELEIGKKFRDVPDRIIDERVFDTLKSWLEIDVRNLINK